MFPTDVNTIPAPIAAPQSAATTAVKTSGAVDEEKLKKAAGDFESILLASMWKSMKQSFGTSEADADPAHGTLDDWGIEIMSGAVGKAGGLGIGRMILEHLHPASKSTPGPVDVPVESARKSKETS
jgi:Rod binding domain-containing protein